MRLNKLYMAVACCYFTAPISITAFAQSDTAKPVEEMVVTGSFIRRDKFEMASPVETIDSQDILSSGYTSIGSFVRDLTYTQNVDTVSNVLGTQDGQQDSNSARFNLRGLGTSSTLTLMDGRRVINDDTVGGIIPDIALQTVDIILDGGAATYGTDAIAGVVNMVPMQSYDGFKLRGFYTVDQEGDVPEPKLSFLWGKTYDRLSVVGAVEWSERKDALYRSDRPKYLRADNDTSTSNSPGVWAQYNGLPSEGGAIPVSVGNPTGGVDPSCGTYNGTHTDDGLAGSYPSGAPVGTLYCAFEYGEFQDYKRPNESLVAYLSATFQLNEDVDLKMMINKMDRTSNLITSPVTAEGGSNNLLQVEASHPNNPFGIDVSPRGTRYRPFTAKSGAPQPSHLDSRGAQNIPYDYDTTQISLGTEFNIGDTGWYGEFWTISAKTRDRIDGRYLNLDRYQLALLGQGGPNGNEFYNPFGSASPQSPFFVAGRSGQGGTENSQEIVDWLYTDADYESLAEDYFSVEGFVTGDIFELPAGAVAMAIGAQQRKLERKEGANTMAATASTIFTNVSATGGPAGLYYGSAPTNGVLTPSYGESKVNALFTEFDIPILDNLTAIVAVRYEDFTDFDLTATVPKISFRYQALDSLSFRASWGEGFLAPEIDEILVDASPNCGEAFTGSDPLVGGTLIGSLVCSNGNSSLDPESSTVANIGFSWRATDDLEISMDYQQIEYEDRIIALSSTDVLNNDNAAFRAANPGYTSGAANAQTLRQAWYAGGMADPNIVRDLNPLSANYESVQRVTTYPDNVASSNIDVIDFRVKYGLDAGDWGYFAVNWATTYYTKYDYADASGETIDANGKQNGDTNFAPPLPEYKNVLRLNWLLDSHTLAMSVKQTPSIEFDASTGPTFGPESIAATGFHVPSRISAFTTIDMRYGYEFHDVLGGSIDFGIGANNITNNNPQPLPVVGGFESRLQDPIGRTFYIEGTYIFD